MKAPFRIHAGDPSGKRPASFSRFVLPFAYRLTPISEASAGELAFVPLGGDGNPELPEEAERRSYYTPETGEALFERTGWFELSADPREPGVEAATGYKWRFRLGTPGEGRRRAFVRVARPQLALFEIHSARRRDESDLGLLHTGFLMLDVHFEGQAEAPMGSGGKPAILGRWEQLLDLNEVFRYWREPFAGHFDKGYGSALGRHLGDARTPGERYLGRWACWLTVPVVHRGQRLALCPASWLQEAQAWAPGTGTGSGWICYADNRTFVWSCAVLPAGSKPFADGDRSPLDSEHWIRLLNVDPSWQTVETGSEFQRHWTNDRTYQRWLQSGSLYGFNYHSGVAIVPPYTDPDLRRHFQWLYFDPVLLLLYLRVSAFRFNAQLSRASQDWTHEGHGLTERVERLKKLRGEYELLTNVYRFPLISNQQQALEMYSRERKALDVEELLDDVHAQLQASHEFLEAAESQEHLRRGTLLGRVGAVGLAVALALALLQLVPVGEGIRGGRLTSAGVREWLYVLATVSGMLGFVQVVKLVMDPQGRWSQVSGGMTRGWRGVLLATGFALTAALLGLIATLL